MKQLGAEDEDGTDYYIAATKVLLHQSLLLNLQLRYTEANQLGLLGFGGDREDGYSPEVGASVGYLLTRKIAIGAEYRGKPHNLGADDESAAWDVFVAWAPTRNVSIVAAYLNLGSVLAPVTTVTDDQSGLVSFVASRILRSALMRTKTLIGALIASRRCWRSPVLPRRRRRFTSRSAASRCCARPWKNS